jgi:hypothetical protein
LLLARYRDELIRTSDGWKIESITTTNRWEEGNLNAIAEAIDNVRLKKSRGQPTPWAAAMSRSAKSRRTAWAVRVRRACQEASARTAITTNQAMKPR